MKVAKKVVDARREKIAALLKKRRYIDLAEICMQFDISEATARRDMTVLESAGRITRTRGGALGDYDASFASLREREHHSYDAKLRIAARAVRLLKENSVCYLDAGSSLLAVAHQLLAHPVNNLCIVTNNLPIADVLSQADNMQLFILGGQLFNRQQALLGEKAQKALSLWKFDVALMGAQGMDAKGIWNSQADLVSFQREVMKRSKAAYFCVDATKLEHSTEFKLGSWDEPFSVITDASYEELTAAKIPHMEKRFLPVA